MSPFESVTKPCPVVAVIGGAVSGSEAAVQLARRGAWVVVLEQNARPYGKIEDGLPRWHEKLRDQEYAKIDENLTHERVLFVPCTALGSDVTLDSLVHELGFSAVVLANGAWRDRPVPIGGADSLVGHGLLYQNAFVQWFNHAHEPGYTGERYTIPNDVAVLGGGLASIDVAKIVNLILYRDALAARGIVVDVVELEVQGIDSVLQKHGIEPASLGIAGATLYYRRRKQDMPLAQAAGDDPKQIAKAEVARVKVMERVERKYLVRFEGLTSPVSAIVEGETLVGLRLVKNEATDKGVKPIAGSEYDVRTSLVISSIGSIPLGLPSVPMRGELYDFEDQETGRLRGHDRVFGLGNVLTGKGNIRDSRQNAIDITEFIAASYLGVAESDAEPGLLVPRISPALLDAATEPTRALDAEARGKIEAWVDARWKTIGYDGSYAAWLEAHHH